jgi:hypothetical protein
MPSQAERRSRKRDRKSDGASEQASADDPPLESRPASGEVSGIQEGSWVEVSGLEAAGSRYLNGLWGRVFAAQTEDAEGDKTRVPVEFSVPFGSKSCRLSKLAMLPESDLEAAEALEQRFTTDVSQGGKGLDEVNIFVQEEYSKQGGWRLLRYATMRHILNMSRWMAEHSSGESGAERLSITGSESEVLSALVAQVLPLVSNVLPRDETGAAVRPHPHPLEKKTCDNDRLRGFDQLTGEMIFRTNKTCDQCNTTITTQNFYTCTKGCDFDFCAACKEEMDKLLEMSDEQHVIWAVEAVSQVAGMIWQLPLTERENLVNSLARDWRLGLFEQLVAAVVDVANSKVVHIEDSRNIMGDRSFWHTIALLQLLYAANSLDASEQRLDEAGVRGPRVQLQAFVLHGIDKCEVGSEYRRWEKHKEISASTLMQKDPLELSDEFCSFLTHANFVSVSFRRECLAMDVFTNMYDARGSRPEPLKLKVRRSPDELREDVLNALSGPSEVISRPFIPSFAGEPATGPGVVTEFIQLAIQAFLEDSTWVYDEQHRCYWFAEPEQPSRALTACLESESESEKEQQDAKQWASLRACGAILGQTVLHSKLIPQVFPRCMYAMLLREAESPHYEAPTLVDLATVSKELSQSLEKLLQYEGDDIDDLFGSMDWPKKPPGTLTHDNKSSFVSSYVEWFFTDRFATQFDAFADGFFGTLGRSELIRRHFDGAQLEAIICGGTIPIDIQALRRSSIEVAWDSTDKDFLDSFWSMLEELDESDRRRFLVFVTASDRMPLNGWAALKITVQKNGSGDDRLPTAFTCFRTLLLPRYSSMERAIEGLRLAINNSQGFGLQ